METRAARELIARGIATIWSARSFMFIARGEIQ
jgi:hypothetical protein